MHKLNGKMEPWNPDFIQIRWNKSFMLLLFLFCCWWLRVVLPLANQLPKTYVFNAEPSWENHHCSLSVMQYYRHSQWSWLLLVPIKAYSKITIRKKPWFNIRRSFLQISVWNIITLYMACSEYHCWLLLCAMGNF